MSPSSWPRCSGARQVIDGAYPVDRDTAGRHPARRPRPPPGLYVFAPASIPRSSRSSSGEADGSSPRGDPRHPDRPCGPHKNPIYKTGGFAPQTCEEPAIPACRSCGCRGDARATGADRTNAAEHHPWLVGVGGPCRRILHLLLRRASGVAGIGSAGIVPRCAQRRARRPPGLPVLRPVRSDRSCALARGDLSIVGVALWWTAAGALLLIAAVFDSVAILILAAVCCGVLRCGPGGRVAGRHPGDRGRSGCGVPGKAISFFFIRCYLGTTLASLGVGFVITFLA